MKLIYCLECFDVVRLKMSRRPRRCECRQSWGRYLPLPRNAPLTARIHAEIGGRAVGIGLSNDSLDAVAAKGNTPAEPPLEAWVLSSEEPTLTILQPATA